jgi:hypothetical protein
MLRHVASGKPPLFADYLTRAHSLTYRCSRWNGGTRKSCPKTQAVAIFHASSGNFLSRSVTCAGRRQSNQPKAWTMTLSPLNPLAVEAWQLSATDSGNP